jgi:CheY-like chemotaxis protein
MLCPGDGIEVKLLPKNILAIDDSLTLRKFIEKALVQEDCVKHLLLAPDSATGLELAVNTRPDLIICDYTLPGMKGDELCRRLATLPETADIPVILMSSSSAEMEALSLQQTNVVRLLVKPFSRELLVATVTYVLSHWDQKQVTDQTASVVGSVVIRGNTDASPMCNALRFIEQKKLTGVLRAQVDGKTLHAFCKEGSVRVISTRNVEDYLHNTPFLTHGKKSPIWKKCEEIQRKTLSPFLLNLSQEGILPDQTAQILTSVYGHRLFARIWTEHGVNYEFEETTLPHFVELCHTPPIRIDDWILDTLRSIDSSDEIQSIIEDPDGIPIFTPRGYRQMQDIDPHQIERQILARITGHTPFNEICRQSRIKPDEVARGIFYFQQLGFVDYWPSYVLQTQS